jgi:hypothetical protein
MPARRRLPTRPAPRTGGTRPATSPGGDRGDRKASVGPKDRIRCPPIDRREKGSDTPGRPIRPSPGWWGHSASRGGAEWMRPSRRITMARRRFRQVMSGSCHGRRSPPHPLPGGRPRDPGADFPGARGGRAPPRARWPGHVDAGTPPTLLAAFAGPTHAAPRGIVPVRTRRIGTRSRGVAPRLLGIVAGGRASRPAPGGLSPGDRGGIPGRSPPSSTPPRRVRGSARAPRLVRASPPATARAPLPPDLLIRAPAPRTRPGSGRCGGRPAPGPLGLAPTGAPRPRIVVPPRVRAGRPSSSDAGAGPPPRRG